MGPRPEKARPNETAARKPVRRRERHPSGTGHEAYERGGRERGRESRREEERERRKR